MSEGRIPERMDQWSRNDRLYETLKGMGLYVVPIPLESDPSRIDHLHVSAGLPAYLAVAPTTKRSAEQTTETGVDLAPQGAKIAERVRPPEGGRGNVVNLPAIPR